MKSLKKILLAPFNAIYQMFLWASGADLEVLKQCPTDKNKYFGIGGTIVFTALMATFAGGYAFFTAFKQVDGVSAVIDGYGETIINETYTTSSYLFTVFFGLFWGFLIFNLDRYIVSTFGVGDGKKTISKQELIEAAPRLLMATLLGFVIAVPLELKIFEKSINVEIEKMIDEDMTSYNQNNPYTFKIESANDLISEKELQITQKTSNISNIEVPLFQQNRMNQLESDMKIIADRVKENRKHHSFSNTKYRNAVSNKDESEQQRWNRNKVYYQGLIDKDDTKYWRLQHELSGLKADNNADFENSKNALATDVANLRSEIDNLKDELQELKEGEKRLLANKKNVVKGYGGLLGRLTALERISYKEEIVRTPITGSNKIVAKSDTLNNVEIPEDTSYQTTFEAGFTTETIKIKTPVWYAKWLLTILFIFIEIAPIMFKMMTERGPYDDIMDRIKHEMKVKQLLLQSNLNEEVNTMVKVHSDKNAQKLNAELSANKELLNSIALAQAEIANAAIQTWKDEQIRKVKEDPSLMIRNKV